MRCIKVLATAILFLFLGVDTVQAQYYPIAVMKELCESQPLDKINIPEPPKPEPADDFRYCKSFTYQGQVHKPSNMTEEEQRYTYDLCIKYNLDYDIIMGIMGVETGWDLYIREINGYAGVGMISVYYDYERMRALGLDLFDPLDGIECLCIVMSEKLERHGTYEKALIAYNCGDAGAKNGYFSKGIYSTGYSKKVLGFANEIRKERTK